MASFAVLIVVPPARLFEMADRKLYLVRRATRPDQAALRACSLEAAIADLELLLQLACPDWRNSDVRLDSLVIRALVELVGALDARGRDGDFDAINAAANRAIDGGGRFATDVAVSMGRLGEVFEKRGDLNTAHRALVRAMEAPSSPTVRLHVLRLLNRVCVQLGRCQSDAIKRDVLLSDGVKYIYHYACEFGGDKFDADAARAIVDACRAHIAFARTSSGRGLHRSTARSVRIARQLLVKTLLHLPDGFDATEPSLMYIRLSLAAAEFPCDRSLLSACIARVRGAVEKGNLRKRSARRWTRQSTACFACYLAAG